MEEVYIFKEKASSKNETIMYFKNKGLNE